MLRFSAAAARKALTRCDRSIFNRSISAGVHRLVMVMKGPLLLPTHPLNFLAAYFFLAGFFTAMNSPRSFVAFRPGCRSCFPDCTFACVVTHLFVDCHYAPFPFSPVFAAQGFDPLAGPRPGAVTPDLVTCRNAREAAVTAASKAASLVNVLGLSLVAHPPFRVVVDDVVGCQSHAFAPWQRMPSARQPSRLQHPLQILLIFLSTLEFSEFSARIVSSPCIAGP
jgi:hypothetical protein